MASVIGIDSSTQSCKVVVVESKTGEVIRTANKSHPEQSDVNPETWLSALQAAINQIDGFDDVEALAVAGQQHGLIALDAKGKVIRPAILWNDTRSADAANKLRKEIGDQEFANRTGSIPVASFTVTKLGWLAEHEPENSARIAAIALPHDWLTWRLRGYGPSSPNLEELTTDRSEASGTGYFNPTTNQYDRDILDVALGRPTSSIVLPRVMEPSESLRLTAGSSGFRKEMIVAAGAGDNAAAALGLAIEGGDVVISIGTSGTVFATSNSSVHDKTGTVAGFADATGGFLPLVATLNAARILDVVAELLAVDHEEFGELALRAKPGASGLTLIPYFEGERTPNLPNAEASLLGMTLESTSRENLARAAIEGMLCGLASGVDALSFVGAECKRILLIGGAARNIAVARIASQVLDMTIEVPEAAEYVAIGAATQATWALSGERSLWPISNAYSLRSDYRPEIRARYLSATES